MRQGWMRALRRDASRQGRSGPWALIACLVFAGSVVSAIDCRAPAWAQAPSDDTAAPTIEPDLLEASPLLRRWQDAIPDIESDIRYDPAFRTRLRFGYVRLPSTDAGSGWGVGVEDVLLGNTPLTLNADWAQTGTGDRTQAGADLRLYLAPLGHPVNVAPIVGYRSLETDAYTSDGLHLGVRLLLVPSRTGAADLSLSQSWVAPGRAMPVSLTTVSGGYAITPDVRLAADWQWQSAPDDQDIRLGLFLEWMP